jgi:hypothetical protein
MRLNFDKDQNEVGGSSKNWIWGLEKHDDGQGELTEFLHGWSSQNGHEHQAKSAWAEKIPVSQLLEFMCYRFVSLSVDVLNCVQLPLICSMCSNT